MARWLFFCFPVWLHCLLGCSFSVGTKWLPLRFSFLLSSVSLPFFYLLCVREESFWSVLSNSPALDKYYDGKGPGTGGWLDPSFLVFFALFLFWFCLCFYSGFPLFFWVFSSLFLLVFLSSYFCFLPWLLACSSLSVFWVFPLGFI
jgi:hypothetical protein